MINQYGADSVRWFILSDSPPEKDIQWSNTGVVSANKFLQKVWDLSLNSKKRKENNKKNNTIEKNFIQTTNSFSFKIDQSINQFRFNVTIALFYEYFNFLKKNFSKKISNKTFLDGIIKFLKLMIPFSTHLASECLEMHLLKKQNQWPTIENIDVQDLKIAVQINGKTRDILVVKKDLSEEDMDKAVKKSPKVKKYTEKGKIIKIIYVKNKIINYIIK
jgi:leucyl-tRNA synthetase